MPSFPTSVFSPTSKSAGQIIQPSHINDLQDEVVAIESGYINGTAPLNAGGSTVTSLNVSGASTLGGTLNVVGGSTFTVRPVTPPPDAVRLEIGSTLALVAGQSTAINWITQSYITNSSLHSTASNSSRITPQSTGVYCITACVAFNPNSSGTRDVEIQDSSGGRIAFSRTFASAQNAIVFSQTTGYKRFDALGGWVQIVATQSSGSTGSIDASAGNTWVSVFKL